MLFNRLLTLSTRVGVGVERSAFGKEDTPLDAFVDDVGRTAGPEAAARVDQGFDRLIEVLGPNLLADVEPIVLPPAFDVDNGRSDTASVSLPEGPYILDIGTTENVGDGEFARTVLGLVDSDGDDNDAEQILREFVTGRSGANLDLEREPGIVGVELSDLTRESYTIAIEDAGATDVLTLGGPGAAAAIAALDGPAHIGDFRNGLSLVEVGVDPVSTGSFLWNPIPDLIGSRLSSEADVRALHDAARAGDDRVELIGSDDDRLSIVVHNPRTGASDTLVLYGEVVEDALGGGHAMAAGAPDPGGWSGFSEDDGFLF
jgi:hypothetical protein